MESDVTSKRQKIGISHSVGSCSSSSSHDVGFVVDAKKEESQQVIDGILAKVEGNMAKSEAAKRQAGQTRHASFKTEAIHACSEYGITQMEVTSKYGITQSILSRWISNQSEIFRVAADKHRKLLRKKGESKK